MLGNTARGCKLIFGNLWLVSPGLSELRRSSKKYGKAGELQIPFLGMGKHFIPALTLVSFSFAAGETVWFSSDPPMLFFHFLHSGKWFRVRIKIDLPVRKDFLCPQETA